MVGTAQARLCPQLRYRAKDVDGRVKPGHDEMS